MKMYHGEVFPSFLFSFFLYLVGWVVEIGEEWKKWWKSETLKKMGIARAKNSIKQYLQEKRTLKWIGHQIVAPGMGPL